MPETTIRTWPDPRYPQKTVSRRPCVGLLGRRRRTVRVRLSTRGPGECERIRTMEDPVEDRVRHRRIAQILVPAVARELTGDHRRPRAVLIVEDLQEVLPLGVFDPRDTPDSVEVWLP